VIEAEVRPNSLPAAAATGFATALQRLAEAALWVTLLGLCAGAFVGLDASSYWVDELWTLFAADPAASTGEVLRRSLMDLHPPAYYLVLHAWMSLVGQSETAARSLSAIFAVSAIAVFVASTGAAFSRAARLFGSVAGAGSVFWFDQAQNLRSYGLAMLILSALLACALRARSGERPGPTLALSFGALGLLGGFTHYYLFLATGLIFLALIFSVRDLRFRLALIGCGLVIAAAVLAFVRLQRSSTLFTVTWFTNDPAFLIAAARDISWSAFGRWSKRILPLLAVCAAAALVLRRRNAGAPSTPPLGRWTAGLCLFVLAGLTSVGLAVSLLLEPSFTGRNLLLAAPCFWGLAAWLYDEATAGLPRRAGLALAALVAAASALNLTGLEGRLLNRKEDWRGSARYVSDLPACRGQDILVVPPDLFAPDSAFYRRLAVERFYGRYYRGGSRLVAASAAELAHSPALGSLLKARARGEDPCPVLAWGAHDMSEANAEALGAALARRPDVTHPVQVRRFPAYVLSDGRWRSAPSGAYVFEVR